MKNFSRRRFLKLTALGSVLSPFYSIAKPIFAPPLKYIERAAFTMGSIATIKAYCEDERLCNFAIDEVFREIKAIDKLMSVFDKKSQLSLVNCHSYEKEVGVDPRIIEVIEHAKHFYKLTNGAFDITVEPLMELYGFRDDKQPHHFPTDRQIAELLDSIGMNNVTVNRQPPTIMLQHSKTRLDFGGIAVGYAIDRAVDILKSQGIESAIINHSGDIFAIGAPPDEDSWEVSIVDPMSAAGGENIITSVRIKNQALSTSGNYENFIEADGKTIGHILNPKTGFTAAELLSTTAIADTSIEADALSTGLFVLGIEPSKAIVQHSKNVKLIAISKDGGHENIVTL